MDPVGRCEKKEIVVLLGCFGADTGEFEAYNNISHILLFSPP